MSNEVLSFPEGVTDEQKEKLTAMQEEVRRGTEAAVQLLIKAEIPFVLLQPIIGTTGIAVISNLNFDYQQLTIMRSLLNMNIVPDSTRKTTVKGPETSVPQ
jgi:hypothetical protein